MLPFIADMPPLEQERVICSITAAIKYEIPANILLAVAEKEGGQPGQRVLNSSNGTYDYGPLQFNTAYLEDLAKFDITAEDVAAPGCYSFDLAAWRIRGHILNDSGDLWTRAANYHSRTPRFNSVYRADLIQKASVWANWLDEHFATTDMGVQGGTTLTSNDEMQQIVQAALQIENSYVSTPSERQERGRKGTDNRALLNEYTPRSITFHDPIADE